MTTGCCVVVARSPISGALLPRGNWRARFCNGSAVAFPVASSSAFLSAAKVGDGAAGRVAVFVVGVPATAKVDAGVAAGTGGRSCGWDDQLFDRDHLSVCCYLRRFPLCITSIGPCLPSPTWIALTAAMAACTRGSDSIASSTPSYLSLGDVRRGSRASMFL